MGDVFYDAFISYSTKDGNFVTTLRLALEQTGKRIWQDVKELQLTEEWWTQIKQGIFASDNFIFIVSPRSMSSPVCQLELEYAQALQKRTIFIRHENAIKEDSVAYMLERIRNQDYLQFITRERDMVALAEKNWQTVEGEQSLFIANKEDIPSQLPTLTEAFDKDFLYIRQSNILLGRAQEWGESQSNPSFLLLGEALLSAEKWQNEGKKPAPTPEHIGYIQESRKAENERQRIAQEQITRTKRLQRVGVFAIASAIVASLISANAINGANIAVAREFTANERSTVASIQVANAQATATQIPPTLTQAAIVQDIALGFGNAMLQRDNPDQQLKELTNLVELYADQSIAYQARGIVYTEQKQYEEAIADFDRAIALDPLNDLAFLGRGRVKYDMGDFEGAIADFSETIRIDPEYPIAYNNRGAARRDVGDFTGALADLNQAIILNPDLVIAYHNRAISYATLGDIPNALKDYDQTILLDDTFAEAYYNRGLIHNEQGNIEDSLEDFERAIALNPQYAPAYGDRGVSLFRMGDVDGAVESFTQAIALDPSYMRAYYNRGVARREKEDFEGALADFNQALLIEPNNPNIHVDRSIIYFSLADKALAPEEQTGFLQQGIQDIRQAERLGFVIPDDFLQEIIETEDALAASATPTASQTAIPSATPTATP